MDLPVFCKLELHNVNDEVFDRDANAQYLVDEEFPVVKRRRRASERVRLAREGTPVPKSRTIQLRLDPASMRDVDVGHVFGSAAEYCDVLLNTTNGNGISGMHFRVQLDYACIEPERLLIRNISRANELFVTAVPYRSDEYKWLSPGSKTVLRHRISYSKPAKGFMDLSDSKLPRLTAKPGNKTPTFYCTVSDAYEASLTFLKANLCKDELTTNVQTSPVDWTSIFAPKIIHNILGEHIELAQVAGALGYKHAALFTTRVNPFEFHELSYPAQRRDDL
ncbi:hypothetical protein LTR86_010930 [Recurvomyces mirabilis]|nr:hypothetical protein LTR86_010930 [Recurvomyces mirabilis]